MYFVCEHNAFCKFACLTFVKCMQTAKKDKLCAGLISHYLKLVLSLACK